MNPLILILAGAGVYWLWNNRASASMMVTYDTFGNPIATLQPVIDNSMIQYYTDQTNLDEWCADGSCDPNAFNSFTDFTGADMTQNPGASNASFSAPSTTNLLAYVVGFFQNLGWTFAQAAGIAANLQTESAFNPTAVGDGGSAYGLAQWHPDRQAVFQKVFGKPIRSGSLDEQLQFVHYELTQGNERTAGAKLQGAQSAADAAAIVSQYYERPADTRGEMSRRGALATQIAQSVAATGSTIV